MKQNQSIRTNHPTSPSLEAKTAGEFFAASTEALKARNFEKAKQFFNAARQLYYLDRDGVNLAAHPGALQIH